MNDRNPSQPLSESLETLQSDDVVVYMSKDVYGRWLWHVVFYSIGEVGALTLTTDRLAANEHLRKNLLRMAVALQDLAQRVE